MGSAPACRERNRRGWSRLTQRIAGTGGAAAGEIVEHAVGGWRQVIARGGITKADIDRLTGLG